MSEYHALEVSGSHLHVVFHIAVPVGNNLVGVSYRTAVVNSGKGGTSVMGSAATEGNGKIGTAELTQIQNGEVYELSETIQIPSDLTTGVQIQAYVDSVFNEKTAQVLSQLQSDLKYFGFNRNVP